MLIGSEDFQGIYNDLKNPLSFILIGVAPPEIYTEANVVALLTVLTKQ